MSKAKALPKRNQVKSADTWDLSSLYADDAAWEKDFKKYEKLIGGYEKYRGKLGDGAKTLADLLKFDDEVDRLGDNLGTYAHLKTAEDTANSTYQRMMGRIRNAVTKANENGSFVRPEILSLSAATIKKYLAAKEMAPFKLVLERVLRYQPHTLSPA